MRKYTLTNPNMAGEISFTFGDAGFITKYEAIGDITIEQHNWIFANFPAYEEHVEVFKKRLQKSSKLICEDIKITFDQFYAKYAYKVGKKEAQNAWNRMSIAKQIQAFNFIDKYFASIRNGIAPKYPATYLNSEPWND